MALIQSWFEETYIHSTIEPLLYFLTFWQYKMIKLVEESDLKKEDVLDIKIEQVHRLTILLRNIRPMQLFLFTRKFIIRPPKNTSTDEYVDIIIPRMNLLINLLQTLQKEMSKIKIKSKNEIYEISFSDDVNKIIGEITEYYE